MSKREPTWTFEGLRIISTENKCYERFIFKHSVRHETERRLMYLTLLNILLFQLTETGRPNVINGGESRLPQKSHIEPRT